MRAGSSLGGLSFFGDLVHYFKVLLLLRVGLLRGLSNENGSEALAQASVGVAWEGLVVMVLLKLFMEKSP